MKKNIEKELKKIISKLFSCSEKKITPTSGPIKGDIEKWDSFGNLELISKVEKKMKIRFSTNQINLINNFKKLLNEVIKAHDRKN
jgi:acyl carrier protein